MVASFPPVLLMRRNIIRKRLAEAGATTPEKALTLAEAGVIKLSSLFEKTSSEELQTTGTISRARNNRNGIRL